jgi:AraC-like DNA-binding protein
MSTGNNMAAPMTGEVGKDARGELRCGMRFFLDWAVYLGPILPGKHSLGSCLVYVGVDQPITVTVDGKSRSAMVCCLPPYTEHTAHCPGGFAAQFDFEPEIFPNELIEAFSTLAGNVQLLPSFVEQMGALQNADVARLFAGITIASRKVDPRIRSVVDTIRNNPFGRHHIDDYAREVGLSTSRFSHLFQKEMGTSFRRFCGWKRIRTSAALICLENTLVNVALASGFCDSAHLSHSVKQFLGYRPRDLWRVFKSGDFDWYLDGALENTMHGNESRLGEMESAHT